MDGGNGCFYGIPHRARRVVEFNVEDKSIKEIGPDLGGQECKYWNGIKAGNGSIYCLPCDAEFILKITLREGQDAEVQVLEAKQFPEGEWFKGALANDGCIYYFPSYPGSILKLDPNNGDNLSLVGEEFDTGFVAAVLGKDGCIYGISYGQVIKFNPVDCSVSQIGSDFDEYHTSNEAVLADDENIYSINEFGQILKIDTSNKYWTLIGSKIYHDYEGCGWRRPVLGFDKILYFPPCDHNRVLKFNPTTQNISLVDSSNGEGFKWKGSVLVSDGLIYCISNHADDVLQIDSRHINEQVIKMIEKIYSSKNSLSQANVSL